MAFLIADSSLRPLAIADNRFPTRAEAREAADYLEIAAGYPRLRVRRAEGGARRKRNAADGAPEVPPLDRWARRRGDRGDVLQWRHPSGRWTASVGGPVADGTFYVFVFSKVSPRLHLESRGHRSALAAHAAFKRWALTGSDAPDLDALARDVRRAFASAATRKFLRGSVLTADDALAFWGARSAADAAARADALDWSLHQALVLAADGAPGAARLPSAQDAYAAWGLSGLLRGRFGAELGLPPPSPLPAARRRKRNGPAWEPAVGERVVGYDHPALGRSWRRGVLAAGPGYVDVEGDPLDPGAPPVRVPRGRVHRAAGPKMNGRAASVVEFEAPARGAAYSAEAEPSGRRVTLRRHGTAAVVAVGTFPPGAERDRAAWLARWGVPAR